MCQLHVFHADVSLRQTALSLAQQWDRTALCSNFSSVHRFQLQFVFQHSQFQFQLIEITLSHNHATLLPVQVISFQSFCCTRTSVVTLASPPASSSLKISYRSFRHAYLISGINFLFHYVGVVLNRSLIGCAYCV